MPPRLKCCVPFCNRTTTRTEFTEWICGDHWKLVDKKHRRVYGRRVREWRRYQTGGKPGLRLWSWIKSKAIERAAGIS